MRKKYDDETLEKVFYYYSLAGNRMLTAAQAADCLNLSESSLFRVMADFREHVSKETEDKLIQKYQDVDIHTVLTVKEQPKNYSNEKNILEDIAITLAEILASVNELKQYMIEKDMPAGEEIHHEDSFLKEVTEEIEEPAWEKLEELEEAEVLADFSMGEEAEEVSVISEEPTLQDLERELAKLEEEETSENQMQEELQKEAVEFDETSVMCVTQLNRMCKEINEFVPYENMEKMWNDWERICRGYGIRINAVYQRHWQQIQKKAKEPITEQTICTICDAQVQQMELELKAASSQDAIKSISYTYYNWVRQIFEMCYLVQAPMSQEKTKTLYTTYLTTLQNASKHKIEQMQKQ